MKRMMLFLILSMSTAAFAQGTSYTPASGGIDFVTRDGKAARIIVPDSGVLTVSTTSTSQIITTGFDGGVPTVSRSGWELIQTWTIPTSDPLWVTGTTVCFQPAGTYASFSGASITGCVSDVSAYRSTLLAASIASVTASGVVTLTDSAAMANTGTLALAVPVGGVVAVGLATNTAGWIQHGEAGAGTTTSSQVIRDDISSPYILPYVALTGTITPASMGPLVVKLYGRR